MSTIMPQGEDIRKAVKWISEQLADNPQQPRMPLVEEAVHRAAQIGHVADFLRSEVLSPLLETWRVASRSRLGRLRRRYSAVRAVT